MTPVDEMKATIEQGLPETLRFLRDLVEINSFTGNAGGVDANAARIIRQFEPLGFRAFQFPCRENGTGSHLLLDSGGDGPVIAAISHLDTVYPEEEERRHEFCWKEEGSRIYGPGTYDIKGGTALLWLMMHSMALRDPDLFANARWMLLWNAAEECFAPDFPVLCREKLPASTKCCLVFEGDNNSAGGFSLIRSRKGRGEFRLKVEGRGAHAGNRHHEGANAIRQLARIVEDLESKTDYQGELTVNVGYFKGGLVANRVPHEAEALLEIRSYDQEVYADVRGQIVGLSDRGNVKAASDGFPCNVMATVESEVPPWPVNPATEQLVGIWEQAAIHCGLAIDAGRRGGVGDANALWTDFPTLDGLGPRGGNPHSSERSADGTKIPEFVDATSIVPKALINCVAIRDILSQP
jgi:glutamate carboxypeptidase